MYQIIGNGLKFLNKYGFFDLFFQIQNKITSVAETTSSWCSPSDYQIEVSHLPNLAAKKSIYIFLNK